MIVVLCCVFFLSGAAALVFEVLWFYLSGIALGNTVWTVSIVLGAFMVGLAAGNAAAFLKGRRVLSSVRLFALLELAIAGSGLASVLLLPHLARFLLPLYRLLQGNPLLLNLTRLSAAFLLLAVPSACMGATLPVLVNALYQRNRNYAGMLGVLYGSNMLGAVAGVLAAEFLLLRALGVRLSGCVAAFLSLAAAAMALAVSRKAGEKTALFIPMKARLPRISGRMARVLCAGALSGGILLFLEVVWFRFFTLFFHSVRATFAILLACVLGGNALGSLAAAWWFMKRKDAHIFIALPVALAGMLVSALYTSFYRILSSLFAVSGASALSLWACAFFMIVPVAFLSGMIFTMLARQLADSFENKIQATGMFTMANTLGSMCGALIGGLLALPHLGMERSFFAACSAYGVLLLLVVRKENLRINRSSATAHKIVIGGYLLFVLVFGFGMMNNFYSKIPLLPFLDDGVRRVLFREGPNETVQCLQADLLDRPYYRYLVTNNHAMSATTSWSRRYMKYFAWFPLAVHPLPDDVLVVSYGLGNTASAFTDDKRVKHIDVVDISRDILETSALVYDEQRRNPLLDHRVSRHIEDGRFFLLTSGKKYDVITGEPPPPKSQGVVSLYTQEYFRLLHDALKEGGMVTYWLPVSHLKPEESRSIIRAFCLVFEDCSLWASLPYEWMLVGTRGHQGPVSDDQFMGLWKNGPEGSELQRLGFFAPQAFGSLFLADGERLEAWLGQAEPLTDNYPARISSEVLDESFIEGAYLELLDPRGSLLDFKESEAVKRLWPPQMYTQALRFFTARDTVFKVLGGYEGMSPIVKIDRCLKYPYLKLFLVWALESDPDAQAILTEALNRGRSVGIEEAGVHLAARALLEGDPLTAEEYYAQIMERFPETADELYGLRMYLLFKSGEQEQAFSLSQEYITAAPEGEEEYRKEKVKRLFDSLE